MDLGEGFSSDSTRFIKAVEAIYDAAPDPAAWPQALQAIADCFEDVGANMIWQRDDGGFATITSPGLAESLKEYQEGGWYLRDTRATRAMERSFYSSSEAATERHFFTEEELASDPFYAEFLARYGLRWCAAVGISPDPRIAAGLAVQRSARKEPYTDEELELVVRLGRYVEKSLRLSMQLLGAELARIGLGEALSRIGIGVFGLDSLKRVVFSNPAGERMLGDGLSLCGERLRAGRSSGAEAFEAAMDTAVGAAAGGALPDPKPIVIPRVEIERPLTVYFLPVTHAASTAHAFLSHTRAIMLVIDPRPDEPADPAVVRDVLGLTLGEARIAAMVGAGMPPKEAAARLGISEETARTVLKRVFSKAGVTRQSELSALLAKLVLR